MNGKGATMASRAPGTRRFSKPANASGTATKQKEEAQILFQQFFKSVGPRTYVSQVKQAGNGNHFLVLTEGKRDDKTGEVRKTRLFVYSEDFVAFFRMLHETAQFVRANPLDPKVKAKRDRYWAKRAVTDEKPAPAPAAASA
jgi:hypothetical protein